MGNAQTEQVPTPPTKILVVDDEPDMATLMQRKFRQRIQEGKFNFLFAEDGYDALKVLETEPDVDLVISDIKMPRMDGLTLLTRLEEIAPLLRAVIVSAYGDMENIRTAMNRGAFDFITKPIDFRDLEITIRKTLAEINELKRAHQALAAAEREKACLAQYFSPTLVNKLSSEPSPLHLGLDRREMSFVFTDLAGFTNMIERTDPAVIVPLLNDYFGEMVEIIFRNEGTIESLVGDGVNVFFGAPVQQPDHARRAVTCALEMDAFSRKFLKQKRTEGVSIGDTRIGVNTGSCLVGNFGCGSLVRYGANGRTVNITARLQTANKLFGTHICVASSTVHGADEAASFLPIGQLLLKGTSQPVTAYTPISGNDMNLESNEAYLNAYRLLEEDNAAGTAAISKVVQDYPEMRLAVMHQKRLARGQEGVLVDVEALR